MRLPRATMARPSYQLGYARSAGESAYPGLWKGVVGAWFPCLGPTGGTVFDISGYGNHGTLTGMALDTDWVIAQDRYALDFDGSNDEVNVDGVQPLISGGSELFLSAWVKLRSYGVVGTAYIRTIMGDDVSALDGTVNFRVGLDGTDGNKDKLYGHITTGVRDSIVGTSVLALNTWYHVALSWKQNGRKKLYLNGVEEADGAADTNPIDADPSGTLFIGDDETRSRNWDGQISGVSISNRVPSPNEVRLLYIDPLALVRRKEWDVASSAAIASIIAQIMHHRKQRRRR